MNYKVFPVMIAIAAGGACYFVFGFTYSFLLIIMSAVISIMSVVLIYEVMAPRFFYYRIRLYEDRNAGMSVEHDFRAKKVKDRDGYEYFQAPSGMKIRAHETKYMCSGTKGQIFGDMFRAEGNDSESQVFPIKTDFMDIEKEEIRKLIIPADQRVWFSDKRIIGFIKDATSMPMDEKLLIINTVLIVSVAILILGTMALYPDFYKQWSAEAAKAVDGQAQTWIKLMNQIKDSQPILCQYTFPEVVRPVVNVTAPPA